MNVAECDPRIACRQRTDGHWRLAHPTPLGDDLPPLSYNQHVRLEWMLKEAATRAYDEGWKACQALIASQQGMRLSRKSTDTQRNAVNVTLPKSGTKGAALWDLFRHAGDHGLTDDEVEVETGWSHQSASAMRNGLMHRGLLKDSGQRRKNRRGLPCIVWVRVSPSRMGTDDRNDSPDSRSHICVWAWHPSGEGEYCRECGNRRNDEGRDEKGELW